MFYRSSGSDSMETYEKSYKGLVFFLIGYMAAMFLPIFLPIDDYRLITRIVLNICSGGIVVLCWMMYRNERIYWINGISFEQAKRATSDQRKEYALWYLQHFGNAALIFLIFSIAAQYLHLSIVLDTLVVTALLVVVAVKSIKVKLENFD